VASPGAGAGPGKEPGRRSEAVSEARGRAPGITERGGRLYLTGELSFATSAQLFAQMKAHLPGDGEMVLDLEGVTRADSSGLALMLEWTEEARRRGRGIRYRGVPDALLNIARFSNVLDLLPLER
jgi:phospholipid transport system transporter-binding protein